MLIIRLDGGLGNQMFQYALGYSLAKYKSTSLKFDLSMLGERNFHEFHTNRNFELDIFEKHYAFASDVEIEKLTRVSYTKKQALIARYIHKTRVPYYKKNAFYEQHHFVFDENILKIPRNCYLLGYWQNEKYFQKYTDDIRKLFTFPMLAETANIELGAKIKSGNSVAIHIRRGDYVHNKNAHSLHGGIADNAYYERAISFVKENVEHPQFFIFSDEVSWVKENMHFPKDSFFVSHNHAERSYIDMQLMSMCKHAIIPNSSFGWWAAWLNSNPEKIIVAPTKWLNAPDVDDSDVCPKSWVRI